VAVGRARVARLLSSCHAACVGINPLTLDQKEHGLIKSLTQNRLQKDLFARFVKRDEPLAVTLLQIDPVVQRPGT